MSELVSRKKRVKLPQGPYVIVTLTPEQEGYLNKAAFDTGSTKEALAGKFLALGLKQGLKFEVLGLGEVN